MKYFRIYKVFLENALSYETQYRADTWLRLIVNVIWVGVLFALIEVIFTHTGTIAGWEKSEVYLMTVLWIIVDEIFTMTCKRGVAMLPDTITDGELDLYLIKPVSTLFLVSTKYFLMRAFYRLLIQLGVLGWLILQYDFAFNSLRIFMTFFMVLLAVLLSYSIQLILNTASFWFERITNINDAWDATRDLGRYPINVLPKTLKIITLTAIPIAFTAYVPVSVLTGKWSTLGLLASVGVTVFFFLSAISFWHFAIKRYSSASS